MSQRLHRAFALRGEIRKHCAKQRRNVSGSIYLPNSNGKPPLRRNALRVVTKMSSNILHEPSHHAGSGVVDGHFAGDVIPVLGSHLEITFAVENTCQVAKRSLVSRNGNCLYLGLACSDSSRCQNASYSRSSNILALRQVSHRNSTKVIGDNLVSYPISVSGTTPLCRSNRNAVTSKPPIDSSRTHTELLPYFDGCPSSLVQLGQYLCWLAFAVFLNTHDRRSIQHG